MVGSDIKEAKLRHPALRPPPNKPIILQPKQWMGTHEFVTNDMIYPLFFFGGPERGSDWKPAMIAEFQHCKWLTRPVLALPTRWRPPHPLARLFSPLPNRFFGRQLDWEQHYMTLAGFPEPVGLRQGCIVFWLGEQTLPRSPEDGPYAQDTYGEIGRWIVHKKYNPGVRLVIGADPKFHGLSQIARNANYDLGYEFPIYTSMRETVRAAVKIALAA
jgi:hypothetical protein